MTGVLAVAGNVAHIRTSHPRKPSRAFVGGAAWHIAQGAARAGMAAAPIAVIGADLTAELSRQAADHLVLDHVRTEAGPSARFDLHYDADDQVHRVESHVGAAAALTVHVLSLAPRFRRWHVSCRRPLDPDTVLGALLHTPGVQVSVDFFASSAENLIPLTVAWLPATSGVFVNAAEHAILVGVISPDRLPLLVVTDGPRRAVCYRHGAVTATVTPPATTAADPTGAGDTLIGDFLAGCHAGHTDADALLRAVSAASEHIAAPRPDPGERG
ncbi:PfkB family carbohydrate kinase [Dactylosporangium sp. CA-152071]|uniref:PfkB family carbohydrate kinase n=1 Tax=Dactylosporangium sp. CA-152071 TaxID=3239933 RepID=UPI003D8B2CB8